MDSEGLSMGRIGTRGAWWRGGLMACLAVTVASALPLSAQTPTPAVSRQSAATLVPIQVTGTQSGPGLWRVSKPGHVLWILGTTSPLPQHMQWQSQEVASALARSQVLLDPPGVKMKLDTGFFGKLWLLPSLIGVRNNPDGQTLRDVVAPQDYARWQILKSRYLGDSDKVERWRPLFAAYQLYRKALAAHGLDNSGGVLAEIRRLALADHLQRLPTKTLVLIEQPRHLVKTFKRSDLDDRQCFAQTLANLDVDMQTLRQRAGAWAAGDIEDLQAAYAHDERVTCMDVISEAGFLKQQGLDDLPARQRQHWLQVTRDALEHHAGVFATLPMDLLLASPSPYLEGLRAAGYRIDAPDAAEPAPAGPPPPSRTAPTGAVPAGAPARSGSVAQ